MGTRLSLLASNNLETFIQLCALPALQNGGFQFLEISTAEGWCLYTQVWPERDGFDNVNHRRDGNSTGQCNLSSAELVALSTQNNQLWSQLIKYNC